MDNLTHSLVGLAAAKAGLERRTPYAAFVCVAAANLPDADIVALVKGPAFYLAHHRGITHSLIGTFALAVAFPVLFYLAERLWARLRGREPRARLGGLLVCSLLLSASHPLLDWTNSYGLRPFLPWDGRWIYGDILFIVDPWVWLVLGGACFLLTGTTRARSLAWGALAVVLTLLFILASRRLEAGAPAASLFVWMAGLGAAFVMYLKGVGVRFGGRVAAAALALVLAYCGVLLVVQSRARAAAEGFARGLAAPSAGRVLRVAATPVLADPLTWRCLVDAERTSFRYHMRLGDSSPEGLRNVARFEKPQGEEREIYERAASDATARVLLDFARFPAARVVRGASGGWVVQFADLRYAEPGAPGRTGGFALQVPVAAR